ncbi:MAG: prepilin-type N-terminal cleavage/methylation domain-containing protein [candidate division Zixibacteria bacterium]|nr:prepilin-type N-terminal cleavage/methylation domain-containing protein [candidate division Zixibacteria bacterium]
MIKMINKIRHMNIRTQNGFTMIEMVMVIVIIGIVASVGTVQMMPSLETSRIEATKAEMQALSFAIVGDPSVYTNGARSDFGYVGDIGSLPANLDALATDPGFGTWDGPYIKSDYGSNDYKEDGWDVLYTYSDTLLRSTGSGSNIDKIYASNSIDLLANSVSGYLLDADSEMPGPVYKDSISVNLIYPNGSGAIATMSINPNDNGDFVFSGIPIGNHTLRVIFIPDSDTSNYNICVMPAGDTKIEILFPADLW